MKSNVVFRTKQFMIVHQYNNKYMIINTNKEFENGHTHVYGLEYAKLLVFILIEKKIKPKHLRLLKSKNFVMSLKRISDKDNDVKRIIDRSLK